MYRLKGTHSIDNSLFVTGIADVTGAAADINMMVREFRNGRQRLARTTGFVENLLNAS